MLSKLLRRRQHGSPSITATVSIHVHDLAQLFSALDPSPVWDCDLDRDAAALIEKEFSEKRTARVWQLGVYAREGAWLADDVQIALRRYYERLAASARHRMRDEMRLGHLALICAVAIVILSMGARAALDALLRGHAPRMLDEGLIILAWLALWRPAESLLYGWIPARRKGRFYERLAGIRVLVHLKPPPAEDSSEVISWNHTRPRPAQARDVETTDAPELVGE